jgi:uncharacterized integral membrane protein
MRQSGGVLIAGVLWTAGYALWVVSLASNSSDPNWLSIGLLWVWGFFIFGSIGSAVERMTDPRAGAWNGAAVGFLLVLFLAVPAMYFAITDSKAPSAETLLAWLAAMIAVAALGAAAGALGGSIIQTDRRRRRRREAAKLRPRLPTDPD